MFFIVYEWFFSDSLKSVSSNRIIDTVRSRLPTVPLTQISDKYNTVIYNARESINSGLINTLPTPVYHMVWHIYSLLLTLPTSVYHGMTHI
jgi:hypothetical protein